MKILIVDDSKLTKIGYHTTFMEKMEMIFFLKIL